MRRGITSIKETYFSCFGIPIAENKWWAPQNLCNSCYLSLMKWKRGNRKAVKFEMPMIWSQPNHENKDCYFCEVTNISKVNRYNKTSFQYPDIASATKPVLKNIEDHIGENSGKSLTLK